MKKSKSSPKKLSNLRQQAEDLLEKNPEAVESMLPEDIQKLVHELNVHQIELEMQNEELRRVQLEIEESRSRFSDLYDFAPVGYFTLDEKGMIVEVNLTGADMLGIERRYLIKRRFSSFIAPNYLDVFYQHRKHVFKSRDHQSCQLKLIKKDDRQFYTQIESIAAKDDKGNFTRLLITITDITPLMQAEEALSKSEQELKIRNRISEIFLTTPDDDMYAEVLQVILEAAESKYGVFGYINQDNGSFVCPSMTRDIWDKCQVSEKDIIFPKDTWGGIWGRALKEKKTLSSNGPFRIPQGHIPITRDIALPIIYHNEPIGLLHVANKMTDYDEKDRALLENIADHIAPVLYARLGKDRQEKERKEAEEELDKYRQHLEELVKERTAELTRTNAQLKKEVTERSQAEEDVIRKHQIQVALNDILNISTKPYGLEEMLDRILGRIISIDWLTLESKGCIFITNRNSSELVLKSYRGISDIFKNLCALIPFGKCVCGKAASTKEIQFVTSDDSAHEIKPEDISPHGHYCIPIISSQRVLGVLSLYVNKDYQRSQDEDYFLQSAANALAGIIKRKQAEEDLKNRQKEIEKLNVNLEKLVQEELEKSRQKDYIMIQKSRLAVMGEMMQYIIHQWGQPLNALNLLFYNLETALDNTDIGTNEKEVEECIANGLVLVKRMFSTIDDFRNFFKPSKVKVEFSVNKNIKDTLSLFGDNLRHSNISVKLNETEDLAVRGFPNELSQVILNILKNAKDAISVNKVKGEIKIDILSKDDSVIVRIKDNGGGIPDNILDKIFNSYFTTKSEDKGTGIGLYMSRVIIEDHMHGRIEVKNIGGGAEFNIIIPLKSK
jgi:PAS domain S-box-containing protein